MYVYAFVMVSMVSCGYSPRIIYLKYQALIRRAQRHNVYTLLSENIMNVKITFQKNIFLKVFCNKRLLRLLDYRYTSVKLRFLILRGTRACESPTSFHGFFRARPHLSLRGRVSENPGNEIGESAEEKPERKLF